MEPNFPSRLFPKLAPVSLEKKTKVSHVWDFYDNIQGGHGASGFGNPSTENSNKLLEFCEWQKHTKCIKPEYVTSLDFFLENSSSTNFAQRVNVVTFNAKPISFTNELEQWYVRHKYFIVLYHRLHVSTYIQVIFRPSFTGKSIKYYTCWDPIMLTEVKYIKT